MLVLGVDPGSLVTGYGLVEKKDDEMVCVRTGTISSSNKIPLCERIHKIFYSMVEVMTEYGPVEMAIEDVFFAKNVKSALKLGHARGAILVAAVQCGLKVFEYTPLEIKNSVVGYGRATKEQVSAMVRLILKVDTPLPSDASDALAAGICHLNWKRYES